MRLTKKEIHTLKKNIQKTDPKAEVYLYGSRADANLKGGDIDLLVISEVISFSQKLDILIKIKNQIGEQKIDILICTKTELTKDSFAQSILKKAIHL